VFYLQLFRLVFPSPVEQMEELMKQTEKECNIMREEATKYLSSTKSEVESKCSTTETRQRNVEAALSEVAFFKFQDKWI